MIRVIRPGLLTSLQDNGRFGYQRFGIGPGGAMDRTAHRLASALVGNPDSVATLECTLTGPELLFETSALLALCGADLSPGIAGQAVPMGRPVLVRAGARLSFGQRRNGVRCYLAVRGGFGAETVMHSQSTSLGGKFGGHAGRAVRKGDRLDGGALAPEQFCPLLAEQLSATSAAFAAPRWRVPLLDDTASPQIVRILEGRHWELFSPEQQQVLLDGEWRISAQSDRMGYRLEGSALALENAGRLVSEAVSFGTVQVPPDGQPIILMADHGTTGGYPKIAQVAGVDLPLLAQMNAHQRIRFEKIPFEMAQQMFLQRENDVETIIASIAQRRFDPA